MSPEKKTRREPKVPRETAALDGAKGDGKTRKAAAPRDLETGTAAAPRRRGKGDGKTRRAAAPRDLEAEKAAGPQDGKRKDSEAGDLAEVRPKKVRVVVVPVWQGPVDWKALEPRLLEMMRARDARSNLTEAELARRLGMDRRHVHKLHEEMKECTIQMLCRWCNGSHVDAVYFLYLGVESLRQEARHARSIKQAKKCPR